APHRAHQPAGSRLAGPAARLLRPGPLTPRAAEGQRFWQSAAVSTSSFGTSPSAMRASNALNSSSDHRRWMWSMAQRQTDSGAFVRQETTNASTTSGGYGVGGAAVRRETTTPSTPWGGCGSAAPPRQPHSASSTGPAHHHPDRITRPYSPSGARRASAHRRPHALWGEGRRRGQSC